MSNVKFGHRSQPELRGAGIDWLAIAPDLMNGKIHSCVSLKRGMHENGSDKINFGSGPEFGYTP